MMSVRLCLAFVVIALALHSRSAAVSSPAPPSPTAPTQSPVQQALRQGEYPWYDSGADRVRPVWPPSWLKWLRDKLRANESAIDRWFKRSGDSRPAGARGNYLGTILLSAVLAAFFVFLFVLWLRREPFAAGSSAAHARPGTAQLLAEIPGEFGQGIDDPWAEAQRLRAAGDFAGAVIYLFAHQLLSLDRAGLIRIVPGWTGRRYVRSLRDPVLVDSLRATLRLFEEIYYGHRRPSATVFERVWSRAQALEARRNELEASR